MLTGKFDYQTQFAAEDHRNFNRNGEAFDVGETFSGLDYNAALEAVEELRGVMPEDLTMAQFALQWILMFDAVTCAIPGGKNGGQVEDNCRASDLPDLTPETMKLVEKIYYGGVAPTVHQRW